MSEKEKASLFYLDACRKTYYEIKCEFCGEIHNKGLDQDIDPFSEGRAVYSANFGGKEICDCCFGKIESSIVDLFGDIVLFIAGYIDYERSLIKELSGDLETARLIVEKEERFQDHLGPEDFETGLKYHELYGHTEEQD